MVFYIYCLKWLAKWIMVYALRYHIFESEFIILIYCINVIIGNDIKTELQIKRVHQTTKIHNVF